ncbi:MAG: two-component system, OmpR family, phosphate regulon response regulator PhoB [Pseudonocardiales bacterium]|jgi:DNA-binding response OmpR family regulator|nr:two-component system, OmpR family, phosphate regulon response regulator PhoB [Pseudonocardiales bacterium]
MTNEPTPDNQLPVALIAEDDRDIRELVTAKLSASGYQVLSFSNGPAALAAANEHQPDVALLDVMMPGISGIEILTRLQKDPRTRSIPVILLTAKSQEFDIDSGFAVGAADYIVKPFSPRDLVARVNAVIGRTPA